MEKTKKLDTLPHESQIERKSLAQREPVKRDEDSENRNNPSEIPLTDLDRSETRTLETEQYNEDDFDFAIPQFESEAQFESWWSSLPAIEIEFDERLGQRVDVPLRLNQRIVDGFRYLAKQRGLQQGEDLMKIILSQYLSACLPDDF